LRCRLFCERKMLAVRCGALIAYVMTETTHYTGKVRSSEQKLRNDDYTDAVAVSNEHVEAWNKRASADALVHGGRRR